MLACLLLVLSSEQARAFEPGAGKFLFEDRAAKSTPQITVWTYRPKQMTGNAPVLIVMHGLQRDGERYRDEWQRYAELNGALLLVPEFPAASFPGSRNYSAARPKAAAGEEDIAPKVYSAIEKIFDRAVSLAQLTTPHYRLYGHSAGAQFVHRFVMFNPHARVKVAVAANAGWYMMPDFDVRFPYGLKGSGIDSGRLKEALAKKLVVLLGEKDTDPAHPSLNRRAGPMRQGKQRFERGQNFFRTASLAAAKLNTPFNWQLATVPNADHDNSKMAEPAARILLR